MYVWKDFQASALFTGLFVGLCMIPGALIGLATGLFMIWKGVQDKNLIGFFGIPVLFFGPITTAVIFAVLSMGVALLSGLVFFSFSPLLRDAIAKPSRPVLALAGAVGGGSGGALWSLMVPFGDSAHRWSGPALTMVLGCIAAVVLPYLEPYAFGNKANKAPTRL